MPLNADESSDPLFAFDERPAVDGFAAWAPLSPLSEPFEGGEEKLSPGQSHPSPSPANFFDVLDEESERSDDSCSPAFPDAAACALFAAGEASGDAAGGAVAAAAEAESAADALVDFVQRHPQLRGLLWSRLRGGFEGCL